MSLGFLNVTLACGPQHDVNCPQYQMGHTSTTAAYTHGAKQACSRKYGITIRFSTSTLLLTRARAFQAEIYKNFQKKTNYLDYFS